MDGMARFTFCSVFASKKKKERQVSRVVIRGIEWVIHEEGGIEYPPVILPQNQPLTRVIS